MACAIQQLMPGNKFLENDTINFNNPRVCVDQTERRCCRAQRADVPTAANTMAKVANNWFATACVSSKRSKIEFAALSCNNITRIRPLHMRKLLNNRNNKISLPCCDETTLALMRIVRYYPGPNIYCLVCHNIWRVIILHALHSRWCESMARGGARKRAAGAVCYCAGRSSGWPKGVGDQKPHWIA